MFIQEVIDKIAESPWGRFWIIFTNFRTTNAGLIGLIIIIRGVTLIADTIIHGYALHRLFGWSIHLLGTFWDSVTNLLLHLGTNRPIQNYDFIPNQSSLKLIQAEYSIRINPNHADLGFIRIHSDWKLGFGLLPWIKSD